MVQYSIGAKIKQVLDSHLHCNKSPLAQVLDIQLDSYRHTRKHVTERTRPLRKLHCIRWKQTTCPRMDKAVE